MLSVLFTTLAVYTKSDCVVISRCQNRVLVPCSVSLRITDGNEIFLCHRKNNDKFLDTLILEQN